MYNYRQTIQPLLKNALRKMEDAQEIEMQYLEHVNAQSFAMFVKEMH